MRVRPIFFLALLALLALPASPAASRVPPGFYGVTYSGDITGAEDRMQALAWERMTRNRVQSARTPFEWARAQPDERGQFDFGASDRHVRDAASAGIRLLPIFTTTPVWAREGADDWWPRRAADFAAYVDASVRRYGPGGTFWQEHPELPQRPVRNWQVFNEPGRSPHYAPLLRAAHRALKSVDPNAKVVLAGLTGTTRGTPWDVLRYQYEKQRIRRWFDVAALHLYTGKPANVLEGVKRFRAVMRKHGDARKALWLTEFGITAARGATDVPRSQRTLATTDEGMARFLRTAYDLLVENRRHRAYRLARAYWYTWASSYDRRGGIFAFAGLNRFADGVLEPRPALTAYRRSARRHQR